MSDLVLIFAGFAIGVASGRLFNAWYVARLHRVRSRLALPGDRIVRRAR